MEKRKISWPCCNSKPDSSVPALSRVSIVRLPTFTVWTCLFILLYFVEQKRTLRSYQREERPARSFSAGFRILDVSVWREICNVMIPHNWSVSGKNRWSAKFYELRKSYFDGQVNLLHFSYFSYSNELRATSSRWRFQAESLILATSSIIFRRFLSAVKLHILYVTGSGTELSPSVHSRSPTAFRSF